MILSGNLVGRPPHAVARNAQSMVAAIEEGRAVYDNIRKFLTYFLTHNVPEAAAFIAFVILGIPLPLTVMQVLAIDLGTDLLPALALGMEPPEPAIMQRPPRRRSERLLNRATMRRVYMWLGPLESVMAMGAFFFAYWLAGAPFGLPLPGDRAIYVTATTMTLTGIVACQVGNVFACRSGHQSVWQLGVLGNRTLLIGVGVAVILLLMLICLPPFAAAFGLAPLGVRHWLLLATFGPALLALEEARKALRAGASNRP